MSKKSSNTASIKLPTVISTAILLNSIVRGSETAVKQLGEEYYTTVRKDLFRNVLAVFKNTPREIIDPLDSSQRVAARENPVWSMDLSDHTIESKSPIFSKIALQYFFLSEEEALAYLNSVEEATVALVLKFAANALKEDSK